MVCWRICSPSSRHCGQLPKASRAPSRFSHWASCALATAFCINTSFLLSSIRSLNGLLLVDNPTVLPPYPTDMICGWSMRASSTS